MTHTIQDLFDKLDIFLNGFVHTGYNALADYMRVPLVFIITFALILLGIRAWFFYDVKVADIFRITFLSFLCSFLLINWANFSFYFVKLFQDGSQQVGDMLLQANPFNTGGTGTSLNQSLQDSWDTVYHIQHVLFSYGGLTNWAPIVYAVLIYIFGFLFLGFVVVELLIAKIMLALTFVVAPLIFPTLFFKRTENIFNGWLGSLFGYALLIILVNALVGLMLGLFYWMLPAHTPYPPHPSDIYFSNLMNDLPLFLLVAIGCFMAVFKVATKAMHWGGGVHSGHGAAATVGGMMAGAAITMGLMKTLHKMAQLFRK